MKRFNDLDEIYQGGIIPMKGTFVCSVCDKEFKREKAAHTHFEKQDCHKYQDVFKGTNTEEFLYEIFRELMIASNQPVYGISRFRTTRYYGPLARFYLFCFHNGIRNHYDYLQYVLDNHKWKVLHQAIFLACQERVLRDYRKFRRENPDYGFSERFYRENEDTIKADPSFTLRSLERGELAVEHLFGMIDLDEFADACTGAEMYRLERFLGSLQ